MKNFLKIKTIHLVMQQPIMTIAASCKSSSKSKKEAVEKRGSRVQASAILSASTVVDRKTSNLLVKTTLQKLVNFTQLATKIRIATKD